MHHGYKNLERAIKYLDYKDFRNILENIDIMTVLHNSNEINNGNPSTIYSSITHEIPMIIPTNLKYMNNILPSFNNFCLNYLCKIVIKTNFKLYICVAEVSKFFIGTLEDQDEVLSFLNGYGLDPNDPINRAELFGIFQEFAL